MQPPHLAVCNRASRACVASTVLDLVPVRQRCQSAKQVDEPSPLLDGNPKQILACACDVVDLLGALVLNLGFGEGDFAVLLCCLA